MRASRSSEQWRQRVAAGVDWAVDVQRRFSEINGSGLAAALTMRSFLAIFPLLVLAIAVLGFLSVGTEDLADRVVDNLGVTGSAAETVTEAVDAAQRSRRTATVVGLLGLVWSGLGLMIGFQLAFNSAWRVHGRGLRDRLIGTGWLLGAGAITVLSIGGVTAAQALPTGAQIATFLLASGLDFAFLCWTSKLLPNREIPWRALVPAAVPAAVAVGVLKYLGAEIVPRLVADSSALYGSIGVVFALLVWLLLFGRVVVYMAVVQARGWERAHDGVLPPVRAGATEASIA